MSTTRPGREIGRVYADQMVADAVLRNRSRTGASPGASCRGAPARGHTGLPLYIFSVGLAVASRATTRRQIVSLTNDLLGQGSRAFGGHARLAVGLAVGSSWTA